MKKSLKGFLDKAGKAVKKGIKSTKTYSSPASVMERKQTELKRLRIENKIAAERRKLEKHKPKNPFGDISF